LTIVRYCVECKTVFDSNPSPIAACPTCSLPTEERQLVKLWKLDASLVGQRVLARILVAGESQQKAVHLRYSASCSCGENHEVDLSTDETAIVRILTHFTRPETIVTRLLPMDSGDSEHRHRWRIQPKGPALDYRILKARDLVEIEETGEKALTTRDYYSILFLKLPAEKKLLIDGTVLIHPKRDDLILLVRDCAPLSSVAEDFKLTSEDVEKLNVLQNFDYDQILEELDKTIAPQIIGRSLAKVSSAITVCSLNWLPPLAEGQAPVPGCCRTWLIGDPRTGKGSTSRWWKEVAGLGEYGFGEAASRAGLLYWVDSESVVIVWGLLVQADLGLAILEGMHGLPQEQVPEFREALAQQRVEVRKKASGVAWARARILADANPSKLLRECVFPCQALGHVKCFVDPADLTRVDIAIPFGDDDVPFSEIQKSVEYAQRKGLEIALLQKLALWAWSRRISDIEITSEAMKSARVLFEELQQYKTGHIPLIHAGSFSTVLRVSAAFAVLTFSSPDGNHLRVEAKHVDFAKRLFVEMLESWAFAEFIQATGKPQITPEEFTEIGTYLESSSVAREALRELSFHRLPGKDLATKLGCSHGYLRDILGQLRAKNLLTRRSEGYDLTPNGVEIVRKLILESPYQKVRDWVLKSKDHDGLVDTASLADFITKQDLDLSKTMARLRKDGLLTDAAVLGKMLVVVHV
jgi:hypothetical protein